MSIDRAAEMATVGALLLRPEAYDEVREWLEPEDFWGTTEQQVFTAARDLHEGGAAVTARGGAGAAAGVGRGVRQAG